MFAMSAKTRAVESASFHNLNANILVHNSQLSSHNYQARAFLTKQVSARKPHLSRKVQHVGVNAKLER